MTKRILKPVNSTQLALFEAAWQHVVPAGVIVSSFQEAIFNFVLNGEGDGLINAVAGAGKSWVLTHSGKLITAGAASSKRATFAAFNRHIAEELNRKLAGTGIRANTINGIGHGCMMKHLGKKVEIKEDKYRHLIRNWFIDHPIQLPGEVLNSPAAIEEIETDFTELIHLTRLNLTDLADLDSLQELVDRYNLNVPDSMLPEMAELIEHGDNLAVNEGLLDFTDQLWLPYRWDLMPPEMDFVFVDEAQDLSAAQLELVLKSRAGNGRFLFVGDPAQAIMSFAGADAKAFWNIKTRTQAVELPLSICYRCPRTHIQVAQKLVPHIRARPDAPEGILRSIPEHALIQDIHGPALILCRMTAPLVSTCIQLIRAGIPARVQGVDIGKRLVQMVRHINRRQPYEFETFKFQVTAYSLQQIEYLKTRRYAQGRIQMVQDMCEAILFCQREFKSQTEDHLCDQIQSLFDDQPAKIWLMTVHRSKGLENAVVYLLHPHRLPLEWKDQQSWEWEQELNLRYVAVTRATQELILLQPEGMNIDYTDQYLETRMAEKSAVYKMLVDIK